ncbi:host-nuclease inhibitor Gam family protein [Sporomusa sphaeroides DSM 2875]|uniref:host-nuclease inhibitor Gam family protein n=1 Tax=Sporomusa sphaeroides TaxID=47679 RepID=UPI00202F7C5C|nr:host-nuclease inhibitor Gam family protein [Sporomusa sphaeroides]MCM0757370.1 host-nuclease inhibitor Gam family protein [Sporomusa sphaeroides DSM 2875]
MATGRKRFDTPALKSWDEADLHLKEIAELELTMQNIEGDMNQKISDAKLAAELQAKPLQDRRKKLELEIKEFVENNRHEIDGKSRRMNFGQVGFRQSTTIVVSKIMAVLESLKARNMLDCITIKESINKEVLRTYPDEVIAAVGARKKVEDVFWLEPDYERLKP